MIYSTDLKPRFAEIIDEVNIILLTANIDSFPFSIKKVIKENTGIACRSYNKAASYGIDMKDFGSQDAICMKHKDKYIIFYNDSNLIVKGRKRFSLAHEFGHISMKHDLDDKNAYELFEVEANFFAAQLLMPEQIINELRERGKQITKDCLKNWFGVSEEAAKKRLETLNRIDYSKLKEDKKAMNIYIVDKFKSFIDNIAPESRNYDYYDPDEEEAMQNERNSWY